MSFSHLGLSDKVLAAVAASGYTTPTPIQEQAIPHVLARRDVLSNIPGGPRHVAGRVQGNASGARIATATLDLAEVK